MNVQDIQRMIATGESETLELKKSTANLARAAETLCAFLNARGGTVIIGVTPEGQIVGQQVSDKTQQEIAGLLQKFEPPAPVDVQCISLPNSELALVVFRVAPSGEVLPFTFAGRPYQRVGTVTSVMPQERYQKLLLDRIHSRHRWENMPAPEGTLDRLDQEEILRTVRLGNAAGRLPESTGTNLVDILDRFGRLVNGELVNGVVVLFGTQFLPYYTQCQLRMARFKGIDKTEFLDNRQIYGHGFQLLDEAMLFLQRHLPVAARIPSDRLERMEEPLFPLAALREALVNAICHRDYSHAGGAISLAIYDDRLEIWSDGTLPFDLRPEDLKKDHPSRLRNPLIAGVFYRRGLIEQWGRGTQKIVELCVKAGHPEPEFVEQAGAVGVRFLPRGYLPPHRVTHDLSDRQREILQVLSQVPRLALRTLRSRLSAPPADRTLRDDLLHLKRLGLVGSVGHGRGAVWFLKKDIEDAANKAE